MQYSVNLCIPQNVRKQTRTYLLVFFLVWEGERVRFITFETQLFQRFGKLYLGSLLAKLELHLGRRMRFDLI